MTVEAASRRFPQRYHEPIHHCVDCPGAILAEELRSAGFAYYATF